MKTGIEGENEALMMWENSAQGEGYRKSQGREVGRRLKSPRKSKRLKVFAHVCRSGFLARVGTLNSPSSNQSAQKKKN